MPKLSIDFSVVEYMEDSLLTLDVSDVWFTIEMMYDEIMEEQRTITSVVMEAYHNIIDSFISYEEYLEITKILIQII